MVRRRLLRLARRQRLEGLAGLGEDREAARGGLVAPNDHVDIERIDLDPAADTTRGLGGDEGRAGAEKRVDDDVAAVGQIDSVSTDSGLEQDFNSLDNQREASRPTSKARPMRDGSSSANAMTMAAFRAGRRSGRRSQKLLDDVWARKIDVIVVYVAPVSSPFDCDDYLISTRATRSTPLSAITRFPSRSVIMLRTTPPPEGMIQL